MMSPNKRESHRMLLTNVAYLVLIYMTLAETSSCYAMLEGR
jgi:hypothetical protein